jgi:hypothetical protein
MKPYAGSDWLPLKPNTLSFWLTVVGTILSAKRYTKPGSLMLMLCGYGGLGIVWDRVAQSDLLQLRYRETWQQVTTLDVVRSIATHLPQAVVGTYLLQRTYKSTYKSTYRSVR